MKTQYKKIFVSQIKVTFVFIFVIFAFPSSASACSDTCGFNITTGGYSYSVSATASYDEGSDGKCHWPSWGCTNLYNEVYSMISPSHLSASWEPSCANSHSYSASITGVPASMVGTCGPATTTPSYTQPTVNTCGPIGGPSGTTTSAMVDTPADSANVNWPDNPKWNWTCKGSVANASVDDPVCSSLMNIDGKCGSATSSAPSVNQPTTNLCNHNYSPFGAIVYANGGFFSWTCNGAAFGANTSCSAPRIASGVCGTSLGACTVGTSTSVTSSTWQCTGVNGGSTVSCSVKDGKCGAANGTTIQNPATLTTVQKCAVGTPTVLVSSGGVYTWKCIGVATTIAPSCAFNNYICGNGGTAFDNTYCATRGGVRCEDQNSTAIFSPNNFCSTFYGYTGNFECAPAGTNDQCSSLLNGACNYNVAKDYTYSEAFPSSGYCNSGTASPAQPSNPTASTPSIWTCNGTGGGANPICQATRQSPPVTAGVKIDFFRFNPSTASAVAPSVCPAFWRTSLTGTGGDPSLVSCTIGSQAVASSSSTGYPLTPGLYTLSCRYDNQPATATSTVSLCRPNPNYGEH